MWVFWEGAEDFFYGVCDGNVVGERGPEVGVVFLEGDRVVVGGDGEVELAAFFAARGGVVEAAEVAGDGVKGEAGFLVEFAGEGLVEGFAGFGFSAGKFVDAAHEVIGRAFKEKYGVVLLDDCADDLLCDAVAEGFFFEILQEGRVW